MRWPYGASWGIAFSLLPASRRWVAAGAGLGAAVWLFELLALPLSGATPPLRKWRLEEVGLDALNSCLYGVVTAAALKGLGSEAG
jgi:hypothetical protein